MDIHQLKVKDVIKQTSDAVTIKFSKPDESWEYKSGQFLTLVTKIGGEEIRRAYSLCSSPDIDDYLAVTAKKIDGGKMSRFLVDHLRVGGELGVMKPMGNFIFDPHPTGQRHIVLIGAGSGITPLISMIKTALYKEKQSVLSLVYANSTDQDIIFKSKLDELLQEFKDRFRVYHYLSSAKKSVDKKGFLGLGKKVVLKEQGRLDSQKLNAILDGLYIQEETDYTEYYLCGPEGLMDIAEACLTNRNVNPKQIFKESFFIAAPVTEEPEIDGPKKVNVVLNGDTYQITVKDDPILTAALENGLDAPYSCQSGLCTACMAKCKTGEVKMEFDDALTEDQIKEGYVLTCIGYPMSDDVTIEYE